MLKVRMINDQLMQLERAFINSDGLKGRSQFKCVYNISFFLYKIVLYIRIEFLNVAGILTMIREMTEK